VKCNSPIIPPPQGVCTVLPSSLRREHLVRFPRGPAGSGEDSCRPETDPRGRRTDGVFPLVRIRGKAGRAAECPSPGRRPGGSQKPPGPKCGGEPICRLLGPLLGLGRGNPLPTFFVLSHIVGALGASFVGFALSTDLPPYHFGPGVHLYTWEGRGLSLLVGDCFFPYRDGLPSP